MFNTIIDSGSPVHYMVIGALCLLVVEIIASGIGSYIAYRKELKELDS